MFKDMYIYIYAYLQFVYHLKTLTLNVINFNCKQNEKYI